jgi:excisionase family DNA binding protein
MTVRGAAETLGVHENTIRNWEARGILRAVRLPGSGFRRFPTEEILALAKTMRASFATHPATVGGPEIAEDRFAGGAYDESLAEQD